MIKIKKLIKKFWFELIFLTIAFAFSWWLMWQTFDYRDGSFYIAAKAWSDFSANIPLIRSFSWGNNFPPEYPLFPGEPIQYHFLFYLMVGLLEKAGLPINWALNLPSIAGFTALLIIIYLFAKLLFNKRIVAFLAITFFLFNGSFSFLEFFRQHPLSLNTPHEIITNQVFPSFGPYDGKIVSAFWNLNIFTNQRHLAPAYFLVLLGVYILVRHVKLEKKLKLWQLVFLGTIVGVLPFFHKVAFIITWVVFVSFFFYFSKLRRPIFTILAISALLALPQLAYQLRGGVPSISWHPGYLIFPPLTISKFISYWSLNLSLSLIFIPIGFILANKLAQKLFLAFFPLFIIGNLFQFSPEIAANHKFFNLFLIVGNIFSAWAIFQLWEKSLLTKLVVPFSIFLLTFSGIIDFFPIKNDSAYAIVDAPENQDILWIKENAPPEAVFLNSSYLYHPASLAGRKIFLGWPYFPWSAGYDTNRREVTRKQVLGASTTNKKTICDILRLNNIKFVSLEKNSPGNFTPNFSFWQNNFIEIYNNPRSGLTIYDVAKSCPL
ncbi:MAG: hypothetical protein ACOZBZ_00510 [Patescibacteria group bacterium]